MKRKLIALALVISSFTARADEGMYPINMIEKAPLKKAGLKINTSDIYNQNGQGLIQAVVNIGGCTGSFVSEKGLIVTNHHCAFGGLEPYSSPKNNLLEKGYVAENATKELPVKGLTVKIMTSNKDVSADILKGTEKLTDAQSKKNLINKNILTLRQAESLKNADYQIEISEMLPGKSYVLFRYITLKDIRIVYIPARNIGEFGGESDNWEWPRHTGDFSFVRAYVGKDGKSAEYNTENVPYQPKEYLNISPTGPEKGDFVFILGYPGRTYQHQPAEYIANQYNNQLPYISKLYEWRINTIKELGKNDPKYMIRMEPEIKQLANVKKNYQGKIKSISKIELYQKKKDKEKEIIELLASKPEMQRNFKNLLFSIDSLYKKVEESNLKQLWYSQLLNENEAMGIANNLLQFHFQFSNAKESEKVRIKQAYLKKLRENYNSIYIKYDSLYLKKMLQDAMVFENTNKVPGLEKTLKSGKKNNNINNWIINAYAKNKLLDSNYVIKMINEKPVNIAKLKDPFFEFAKNISSDLFYTDSAQSSYRILLDEILPKYVDLRMEAMGQLFIPDANRTLRLTYGYIKGYSPADGIQYEPFTTISGMVEKDGDKPDYVLNKEVEELYNKKDFGNYKPANANDLPLAMLYNTHTTGGNSGSPVLNAKGQLIAVNFDRSYEATVNDYAWDDSYSRSIGVDMRFVLWATEKIAKAKYLIDEMFVEPEATKKK